MAIFNKMTIMTVTEENMENLRNAQKFFRQVLNQVENDNVYFIESLETGEIIESPKIRQALNIIESLLDEKTGRNWKLV